MNNLKPLGIILLCMGIINHLVDQLCVAFDGERTIYRFIFSLVGYVGFLIIWMIEK
jgi:hypothetical protein